MSTANKILMGANGAGGPVGPSDDEFNRTSFLSHFEGSNNGVNNVFDDSSASNHTVTANGNVTQGSFGPFARPDGEWAFNNTASTNDSFKVTAHDNFDMTNPFTIEGWIFLSDLTANKLLFGRENNYWMSHDYQGIGGASGKLGFNYQNSGSWGAINASAATVANTWYFLQATYVGTTVTFYINGVSQGTASVGSPSSNTDKPFYVLSGPGQKHTGTASNVRLSSVARSTSLPTAKFTSDSDTELLVCQSNRFVDNGPDGHTITTTAGASVSAFGPFLTSSVYDPAVNGASMQGFAMTAGDSVQIAQTTDTNLTGDFTVECWVYFNDLDSGHGLIGKWANGTYGWLLSLIVGSGFQFQIRDNGSNPVSVNSGTTATTGQWYHVAACRTGTTVSMFVNGVRAATVTTANNGTISSITSIGNYYSSADNRYLEGYLCDARIINGTAAYDGTTYTIPTAPLTAVTNTKLLLNMADGQAIDSTAQDNIKLETGAKLSTAQYKFGTSSILFDAEADNRASFKTKPFGTGDFTIEGFFRKVAEKGDNDAIWDSRGVGQSGAGYFTLIDDTTPGQTREMYFYNGQTQFRCGSASALSLNTWYHIAVCRSGTSLKVFLDGTQVGSTFSDSTNYINDYFSLGNFGANFSAARGWDGYVDEFRISYMARYTSNFTAPSEPFADKGK